MSLLLDVVAPLPLAAGYPINEDLFQIGVVFLLLAVVDRLVVSKYLHTSSRYFALHAVANAISATCSFPDVVRAFVDPLHALTGPSHTMWANSAIVAIHSYHVAFFSLKVA